MAAADKSLKVQNIGWLWAVVAADALVLLAFVVPAVFDPATINDYAWMRASVAAAAPVLVLLLATLLPSNAKASLVFWRLRDALPGHRAFSVHAVGDPRIGLEALRKNVGAFPEAPRDQNVMWYRLYKKVEGDTSVAQAHRHYLLFRDLAALSLLLAPMAALTLQTLGVAPIAVGLASLVLMGQYAATAVAARNCGVRLVTNVLAQHSAKRRT